MKTMLFLFRIGGNRVHHTVITRKKDKGNVKINKTLLSDKYLAVLEIIFLTLPCCAALRDQTKQLSRKIKTIS